MLNLKESSDNNDSAGENILSSDSAGENIPYSMLKSRPLSQ